MRSSPRISQQNSEFIIKLQTVEIGSTLIVNFSEMVGAKCIACAVLRFPHKDILKRDLSTNELFRASS